MFLHLLMFYLKCVIKNRRQYWTIGNE